MRKWTEVVKPYQDFASGTFYKVQVKNITRTAHPRAMEIDLEFLDASQRGRRMLIQLPLPMREGSLSANFLRACGLVVAPETRLSPRDAINAVLAASFEKTTDGKGRRAIDFKSITKG